MSGLFDGAENARLSNVERECRRWEVEHMPEMIKAFKEKAEKEAAEKAAAGSQAPAETPAPAGAKPAAPGAKAA